MCLCLCVCVADKNHTCAIQYERDTAQDRVTVSKKETMHQSITTTVHRSMVSNPLHLVASRQQR